MAGLSLGIRLLRRGENVTIYEAGNSVGGLCVNWRRGDYDFNGCLHWVLGARAGSSFHDMWRDVCDIDSLKFIDFDERVDIEVPDEDGGVWHFHLYNDVDRLQDYLLALSPADARAIRRWMDAVRTVSRFLPDLPPYPRSSSRVRRALHYASLWRMWPMLPLMARWGSLSTFSFAETLKGARLREAVRRLYMNETAMTVVIFGQAYMATRVAAYPIGGSRALSDLLLRTFLSLGGHVEFGARVEKIRVDGGRAVGLELADGRVTSSDAVCSCADWRWTVGHALGGRFLSKAARSLLSVDKTSIFYSYCRVHIGVASRLDDIPHFLRIDESGVLPDGTPFSQIEVEVNSFDPLLAAEGKTTLTVNFTTREGQWWINLRNSSREAYKAAKNDVARTAMAALTRKFPGSFSESIVEVVDVTSPATYHRFTSNHLGSSQGWSPMKNIMRRPPLSSTLPGLRGFALAGHWLEAGGGLPIALISALRAERAIISDL